MSSFTSTPTMESSVSTVIDTHNQLDIECESREIDDNSTKSSLYQEIDSNEADFDHVQNIKRPVIHYITEPAGKTIDNARRVVAMAMNYDKTTGKVYYGACIFRRDFDTEVCKRKLIRQTAEQRLRVSPNIISFKFEDDTKVNDIAKIIRIATTKIGVSGKRRKALNNSPTNSDSDSKPEFGLESTCFDSDAISK